MRERGWRRALAALRWTALGVLVLAIVAGVSSATPWPSALVIRSVFAKGAADTVAAMQPFVPRSGVVEQLGVQYGDGGSDTTLDAFRPAPAAGALPVVVWIHGGAWISGSSADVDPYLRILASHGYATVGLDYTVGPEGIYPTALEQLNGALRFLLAHATRFGIDPERIVLAGDSAGAQLASQLDVLVSSPAYSHLLGIRPALKPHQLVATVLNCGVYDLDALAKLTGVGAWGFKTALWAYTGTKDWSQTSVDSTMSTIQHVTAEFPPTFITGGNGDALTWMESVPMSRALSERGVTVTTLFWAVGHEPALPHEYQFQLQLPEAQKALATTVDFLAEHTR